MHTPPAVSEALEPRRLMADFAPDPTWGGDGAREGFYTDFADTEFDGRGRLYVLHSGHNPEGFRVQRLLSNGKLDTTYGTRGETLVDGTGGYSNMDVGDDGSAAVAPQRFGAAPPRVFLLDPSGNVLFNSRIRTTGGAIVRGLSIAADGGVVAVTQSLTVGADRVIEVYKFRRDGTFDAAFGRSGRLVLKGAPFDGLFVDFTATDPQGRMTLLLREGLGPRQIIARVAADGTLDKTFAGGDGHMPSPVRFDWNSRDQASFPITIRPDGKIVLHDADMIAGTQNTPARIVRLNADGTFDGTFGNGGVVTNPDGLDPATRRSSLAHVAPSPDGRFVYFVGNGRALRRLDGNGVLDRTFRVRANVVDPAVDIQRPIVGVDGRLYARGDIYGARVGGLLRLANLRPVHLNTDGDLRILATDASDRIFLKQRGPQTVLSFNDNVSVFATSAIRRITVYAYGGNDRIELATGRPAFVDAGTGNNRVVGTDGRDTIVTGRGDDVIFGRAGDDQIDAGRGNNRIAVGDGACVIKTGSTGNNRIEAGTGAKSIFTGDGDDTITSAAGRVFLISGGGDDRITLGGTRGAKVDAGDGNDAITGGSGDDTLFGGRGDDEIDGARGDDLLNGGDGDDVVFCSNGTDTLTGGAGRDTFLRYYDEDFGTSGNAIDLITDRTGEDSVLSD